MAINYITRLLKVFLLFLFAFGLCRLFFLFSVWHDIRPEGWHIYFLSLIKALPLDVSTACYLCFIPALFFFSGSLFAPKFFTGFVKAYLLFVLVCYTLMCIADIFVYQELRVKLYYNLFSRIGHPQEVADYVSAPALIAGLLAIAAVVFICFKLVNRVLPAARTVQAAANFKNVSLTLLIFVISCTALVIGCRGGLQPVAINEGEVYFSTNQVVNDATINTLWYLTHSFIEERKAQTTNIYEATSMEEADKIVHGLYYVEKDSTIHLLKCARPNICFIILESWSSAMVSSLNGFDNITPNFAKLESEGYLFTNIESSGHASDQGIPAILSGYPSLPIGSAINQPEKQVHLTGINKELIKDNYHSSFFYGGQLMYGGIKAYIYRSGFEQVIEQKDLPGSLPAGRMGIHDSLMLNIWFDSLNTMKAPFFSCFYTLSSHAPFDAPSPQTINWGGREMKYLNGVAYSDRQLGIFFEKARQQPWYDSTLFVLVADHSHTTPKNYPFGTPAFNHIPLLFCGGALKEKYRGVKDDKLGSQVDIVATVLHQIGLPSTEFVWSKDLMNPYTQRFAFYTFPDAFAFCDTSGATVFSYRYPAADTGKVTDEKQKELRLKEGHAMLQELMHDFLSK